jgi:glycosyltransferase involved in cell wall biosynthesis
MTQPRDIIFWQNMPSLHQAPLLNALSVIPGTRVSGVFEEPLANWRIASGWKAASFLPSVTVHQTPDRAARVAIISEAGPDAVHIFSGLHAYPETQWTLGRVTRARERGQLQALVMVMVEQWDPRGPRALIRRQRARRSAMRLRSQIDALLAIGTNAPSQYRWAGFSPSQIIPFGYFPEVVLPCTPPDPLETALTIAFVGQCIPRKGGDILLRALAALERDDWLLHVVGDGPERHVWHRLSTHLGLDHQIVWDGAQPRDSALAIISQAGLLVCPSRYDGWGAVINEALQLGTPVVASSAVGASSLLVHEAATEVFPSGSVAALTDALRERMNTATHAQEARHALIASAASAVSPSAGCEYLRQIIHFHSPQRLPNLPFPRPPWEVPNSPSLET